MRKNIITYVVSLLTLVVVAAGALIGFGDDLSMTAEAAAIKAGDVDEDILHVKCQTNVTGNEGSQTADLRMVSSIDSLEYDAVGFEVYFLKDDNGTASVYKWFENQTTKVFEKIETKTEGLEYTFSPQIFSVDSQYFMTYTITGIDDDKFDDGILIKPFAMEEGANGARVYGRSKYTTINDMENKNLYIAVKGFENVDVDNISVSLDDETVGTYSGTENLEVEYVNGSSMSNAGCGSETNTVDKEKGLSDDYTHIKISDSEYDGESLKSVTTFTVTTGGGDSTGETVTMTHRNLHYTREENEEITPDTTWYDSDATKFVIVTEADLYGLASVVNDGTNFHKRTIYLAGEITVNDPNTMDAVRKNDTDDKAIPWTPIASGGTQFRGTFLGQNHDVNGLYYKDDAVSNVGMFGVIYIGGSVKDVRLRDSYFVAKSNVGGIAGRLAAGEIIGCYSDAEIKCSWNTAGGIVGTIEPLNDQKNTADVKSCWFSGSVTSSGNRRNYIGGIVGSAMASTNSSTYGRTVDARISDCLNTGVVSAYREGNIAVFAGGICGGQGGLATLTIESCLNAGSVENKYKGDWVKAVNGVFGGVGEKAYDAVDTDKECPTNGAVTLADAYTTTNCGTLMWAVTTGENPTAYVAGAETYTINGREVVFEDGTTDSGSTANPIVEVADIAVEAPGETLKGFDFKDTWSAANKCYPVPAGLKDLQQVIPSLSE